MRIWMVPRGGAERLSMEPARGEPIHWTLVVSSDRHARTSRRQREQAAIDLRFRQSEDTAFDHRLLAVAREDEAQEFGGRCIHRLARRFVEVDIELASHRIAAIAAIGAAGQIRLT